jgi:hypothetical protein
VESGSRLLYLSLRVSQSNTECDSRIFDTLQSSTRHSCRRRASLSRMSVESSLSSLSPPTLTSWVHIGNNSPGIQQVQVIATQLVGLKLYSRCIFAPIESQLGRSIKCANAGWTLQLQSLFLSRGRFISVQTVPQYFILYIKMILCRCHSRPINFKIKLTQLTFNFITSKVQLWHLAIPDGRNFLRRESKQQCQLENMQGCSPW